MGKGGGLAPAFITSCLSFGMNERAGREGEAGFFLLGESV